MKIARKREGGYIAITTTIIISLVLLSTIAESGLVGWYARFAALNREKKHAANALASGCIDTALALLIKNPALAAVETTVSLAGCDVTIVDASNSHAVELRVQSRSGMPENGGVAYSNMKVIADFGDVHLGEAVLDLAPHQGSLSVTVISEQEILTTE